jgi:hypothetical protein
LDPGTRENWQKKLGRFYVMGKSGGIDRLSVEIVHVKKGAKAGMQDAIDSLEAAIDLKIYSDEGKPIVRMIS